MHKVKKKAKPAITNIAHVQAYYGDYCFSVNYRCGRIDDVFYMYKTHIIRDSLPLMYNVTTAHGVGRKRLRYMIKDLYAYNFSLTSEKK